MNGLKKLKAVFNFNCADMFGDKPSEIYFITELQLPITTEIASLLTKYFN
jgi:hypothetical protein